MRMTLNLWELLAVTLQHVTFQASMSTGQHWVKSQVVLYTCEVEEQC